jgi:chromate transporter
MGRKLCPDLPRLFLALACGGLLLLVPGALPQLGVMVLGGLLGWLLYRHQHHSIARGHGSPWHEHRGALAALLCFAALLLLLPLAARLLGWQWLRWFDSFYRSGSLVFGGGHVVLPLLRAELVPTGWLADSQFLAGYGMAQALPGPLFTLSAYLGTVMQGGPQAWLGGCVCLLGIFLPAWLLIGGSLPFWHRLRDRGWMQAALQGTNAAVVGLLLAAFVNPICREGLAGTRDLFMAFACLIALERFKAPSWLIVLACAAYAQWPLP